MPIKNSSDIIGNQTHNLLARSAVPQPAATPDAPLLYYYFVIMVTEKSL
jgi:hypothetical protein